MAADMPPAHTIEALNLILGEDQVRSWVLRWQLASAGTKQLMETEAALKGAALANSDPHRSAERQELRRLFEREGLEGNSGN